ncbi:MAG: hypothetical protein JXA18_05775 [Chitinispirillaceae bacterium]|nr:hypothetical protein [Chitinispirillaceae bacterium]
MGKKAILLFLAALYVSGAGMESSEAVNASTALGEGENDSIAATANIDTAMTPAIRDSFPSAGPAAGGNPDRSAVTEKGAVQSETETSKRSSARKISLIKRQYNYRQQIILAIGMMAFVAIIMTSAQSWNPK